MKIVLLSFLLTLQIGIAAAQSVTSTNATITYNDDGTVSIEMVIASDDPMTADILPPSDQPTGSEPAEPPVIAPPANPTSSPDPVPTPDLAPTLAAGCTAFGSTVSQARSAFAQQCAAYTRTDCDPIDGQWMCSSDVIGSNAPGAASAPSVIAPAIPIVTGGSSAPIASQSLIAEIENGQIANPGLWAATADGLRWIGPNRFNIGQREDDGNVAVQVTVPNTGRYKVVSRTRIVSGIQTEPPNDMWVTVGDLGWTKAFILQGTVGFVDDGLRGHVGDDTNFPLETDLTTGTHTITISGRSTGFEIDWVGLQQIGGSTNSSVSNSNVLGLTIPNITPQPNWIDSYSANGQCYCQTTFDHGIGDQMVSTNAGLRSVRTICELIGPGPGLGNNPQYNDVQCGHGPDNGLNDEMVCPGRIDQGPEGCIVQGPTWNLSSVFPASNGAVGALGKIEPGDLLALHYDNAPDRDDGHALVAGRVLTDFYGVQNVLAVNGTYGYLRRGNFQQESQDLFGNVWPDGLDAFADRNGAVAASASRWAATISNGGRVWVAEGGPSDFTADVLRNLPSQYRSSVTIVQHSHGWNEDNTDPANIAFMSSVSNYVRIDNGNLGNNGTADLNAGATPNNDLFVVSALASQWGTFWQQAFSYLPPVNKLDFSDTVEYLWILDVPLSVVADTDDFAIRYLGG